MMSIDSIILALVDAVVEDEMKETRKRIYNELIRRLTLIHEIDRDIARKIESSKKEKDCDVAPESTDNPQG